MSKTEGLNAASVVTGYAIRQLIVCVAFKDLKL